MRSAYLETLYDIASKDRNVFAVISDNGAIVYDKYRQDLPDQYINAGISEANMVAMAAGMAERGKIPFAYTIGAFLAYRAYEFILNDVCLQNKNVKLVGIGAGCSYSLLGSSHHTIFDMSALRTIPNLLVLSPASPMEVRKVVRVAYETEGPVYIRLGTNRESEIYNEDYDFIIGKVITLHEGEDATIIGTGSILWDILEVANQFESEGIYVRVLNMHTVKPIDTEAIQRAVDETGKIITVEDHSVIGGIGSAVADVIAEYGRTVEFKRMGLSDFSRGYGTYAEVKAENGVGKKNIEDVVRATIGK